MSIRPGISLLRQCARPRTFHYLARQPGSVSKFAPQAHAGPRAVAIPRTLPRAGAPGIAAAIALGLGITAFTFSRPAQLDAPVAGGAKPIVVTPTGVNETGQAPQSIVSLPQLTFGAVCGICSGVFVKKGFRLVAFALGAVFVLLQYLSSKQYINVDWNKVQKSYDGSFATTDAAGNVKYPTPTGLLNGFINFLTANFQQRAMFITGFVLGLRIG